MARFVAAVFLLISVLSAGASSAEESVFTDDFSKEVEGRWEAVNGEWVVRDGRLVHPDTSSYNHDCAVADFPLSEGMIEVVGVARGNNILDWASVGIALKYIDDENRLYFRYGSYNRLSTMWRVSGRSEGLQLGRGGPELGRPYRLKAVMRNGLVGISLDGIMIVIFPDPLAGRSGRPGVFTESHAEFDNFRVVRWLP